MISRNPLAQPSLVWLISGVAQALIRVCWSRPGKWLLCLIPVPLLLAAGCATVLHKTVPKELISEATVPDMPNSLEMPHSLSVGVSADLTSYFFE